MRKDIKELTNDEAKEIFDYVNTDEYAYFEALITEPEIDNEGNIRVTLGLRPAVGIYYRNGSGDGCLLHFDHTGVISWLYNNNYEIGVLLENNKYLSNIEEDIDNLAFAIHWQCKGKPENLLQTIGVDSVTLDKTREELLKAADRYYYNVEY